MAETVVTLNANVTAGAGVAVWQDAGNREHQEVIMQTQSGAADPISVSTANPVPVGGTVADLVADAGNAVKVGGVYHAVAPTVADGQRVSAQMDAAGNLKVNVAAGGSAGGTSSAIGAAAPGVATAAGFSDGTNLRLAVVDGSGNLKVNIAAGGVASGQDNTAFTAGTTQGLPAIMVADNTNAVGAVTQGNQGIPKMTLDRKQWVAVGAQATGGWTPHKKTSAATTNGTRLKASAGQIGYIYATNTGAAFAYVKLYNNTNNPPVVGTDVPVQVYGLPPGGGGNLPIPAGIVFDTGIGYGITAGTGADADVNAVLLSQVNLNIGYA